MSKTNQTDTSSGAKPSSQATSTDTGASNEPALAQLAALRDEFATEIELHKEAVGRQQLNLKALHETFSGLELQWHTLTDWANTTPAETDNADPELEAAVDIESPAEIEIAQKELESLFAICKEQAGKILSSTQSLKDSVQFFVDEDVLPQATSAVSQLQKLEETLTTLAQVRFDPQTALELDFPFLDVAPLTQTALETCARECRMPAADKTSKRELEFCEEIRTKHPDIVLHHPEFRAGLPQIEIEVIEASRMLIEHRPEQAIDEGLKKLRQVGEKSWRKALTRVHDRGTLSDDERDALLTKMGVKVAAAPTNARKVTPQMQQAIVLSELNDLGLDAKKKKEVVRTIVPGAVTRALDELNERTDNPDLSRAILILNPGLLKNISLSDGMFERYCDALHEIAPFIEQLCDEDGTLSLHKIASLDGILASAEELNKIQDIRDKFASRAQAIRNIGYSGNAPYAIAVLCFGCLLHGGWKSVSPETFRHNMRRHLGDPSPLVIKAMTEEADVLKGLGVFVSGRDGYYHNTGSVHEVYSGTVSWLRDLGANYHWVIAEEALRQGAKH